MMKAPRVVLTSGDGTQNSILYRVWQALKKFLGIPLAILLASLLFSLLLYALDRNPPGWLRPARDFLSQHLFPTSDTAGAFLGMVAGGMFTQTSIVVSMLLLVLQQTASAMGNLIYDQFLRRHRNQIYAGFVVGALLVALTLRATVSDDLNPVLGATGVLVLASISLGLLIWFLYSTIHQMRPETVVETIHDETEEARRRERAFLSRLRSESTVDRPPQVVLRAKTHGFLTHVDLDVIEDCLSGHRHAETEIVLRIELGDYLAYHDCLADVKAKDQEEAERLARCVGRALRFARERNIGQDPAYGVKQLETIGWTETSTAKDNPGTSLMVLHGLRDLMSCWLAEESEDVQTAEKLPVVYEKDTLFAIIDAWEALVTVSSESMQHQAFAEILQSLAVVYPRFSPRLRDRADDLIRRAVSAMGDHVLTEDVESGLRELLRVLARTGRHEMALMLEEAHEELAASLGNLANRSTRVKQAGGGDG